MSAAMPMDPRVPLDRRALLRGGVLGAAALGLAAVGHGGTAGLAAEFARSVGAAVGPASVARGVAYPHLAQWEQIVGDHVMLAMAAGGRHRAQVVDVTAAPDARHAGLEGEAYSVLLDAPRLPPAPSLTVAVRHPAIEVPALDILPVDGDGSWEAVVDTRHLRTHG